MDYPAFRDQIMLTEERIQEKAVDLVNFRNLLVSFHLLAFVSPFSGLAAFFGDIFSEMFAVQLLCIGVTLVILAHVGFQSLFCFLRFCLSASFPLPLVHVQQVLAAHSVNGLVRIPALLAAVVLGQAKRPGHRKTINTCINDRPVVLDCMRMTEKCHNNFFQGRFIVLQREMVKTCGSP